MGKRAQYADSLQGEARIKGWNGILDHHGREGLTPEELDPITGPKLMMAAAGLYKDPVEAEKNRLDLDYKRAQIAELNRKPAGGENPSNVREWEYYTKLAPEQRAEYLNMKRSVPYLDTGTQFVQPNPVGPEQPPRTVDKNVAETEAQKIVGRETGEGRMALPKMERSLQVYEQQAAIMDSTIDKAIEMAGKSGTAGFVGAGARFIPGTEAYDLSQTLQTIKANIGFDKLQEMRDNSPTGGALGQVAVQEMQALQSVFGSLDQAQSAAQLINGLNQVKAVRKHFAALRRQAYEQDVQRFGAANVPNPSEQPSPAAPSNPYVDRYGLEK